MKCNKCGTINNDDAKFCRSCGAELINEARQSNVMDLYSEYDFESTNLIEWKKPYVNMVISLLFIILACFFAILLIPEIVWIINEIISYNLFFGLSEIIGCLLCIIMPLFISWFFWRRFPNLQSEKLSDYADYIQKYSYPILTLKNTPKYVFFVKNGNFGIMDVAHYIVHIPAEYELLSWKEKNKYLTAKKDGQTFVIDIYGKHLN